MATRLSTSVEEQFSPQQVADRLNVSLDTVRRAIRCRRIKPVHKLGRLVRIPASAVNGWLASRRV